MSVIYLIYEYVCICRRAQYICMHIYVYDKVVHDITQKLKGTNYKLPCDTSKKYTVTRQE